MRIHDLRHTFASMAASKGIPIHIVGHLMGHKDAASTQQYAHIFEDAAKKAAENISEALNSKTQN